MVQRKKNVKSSFLSRLNNNSFHCRRSLSIPPENIRKTSVFLMFLGGIEKEIATLKRLSNIDEISEAAHQRCS